MNIVEKLIAGFIERSFGSKITTIIGVLLGVVAVFNQCGSMIPVHYQGYVSLAVGIAAGVALILAHDKGIQVDLPQKLGVLLVALLILPCTLHAQTTVPEGTLPANIYAVGPSYNPSASPSIAGSAFYGRLVTGTGTYAFTVMDALPEPVKPFTVSTNVGMGVAQKLVTLRNVPIYGAMGTGIHWTGASTDWQWNGGALAAIPLKKACATCYLMPNARFLSVGGGQYRPIVGLWFGFGQ